MDKVQQQKCYRAKLEFEIQQQQKNQLYYLTECTAVDKYAHTHRKKTYQIMLAFLTLPYIFEQLHETHRRVALKRHVLHKEESAAVQSHTVFSQRWTRFSLFHPCRSEKTADEALNSCFQAN